jgi:hypothetical protein
MHIAPATDGALEREGRGLEADDHHLEAQQPEVRLPPLCQLAEAAGAHGLEEGGGDVVVFRRRRGVAGGGDEVRAGLLEGGPGEVVVDCGEGAVALLGWGSCHVCMS